MGERRLLSACKAGVILPPAVVFVALSIGDTVQGWKSVVVSVAARIAIHADWGSLCGVNVGLYRGGSMRWFRLLGGPGCWSQNHAC